MRAPFRRPGALASLALTAALFAPACVGPFNTWHQVLHWNRSVVQNKWAAEGIFLGFVIIPVYSIAFLVDAVVFNSIEFWGGNPVFDPAPYSPTGSLDMKSMSTSTAPGAMEATPTEGN